LLILFLLCKGRQNGKKSNLNKIEASEVDKILEQKDSVSNQVWTTTKYKRSIRRILQKKMVK